MVHSRVVIKAFSGAAVIAVGLLGAAVQSASALQDSQSGLRVSDTAAQANRALAYQRAGDLNQAVATYASLEASTNVLHKSLPPAVLANYARALAASGKLDDAATKMKAAISSDPRNATLADDLGSIYARQQRWAEAEAYFATAVRLAPTLAVAHLHLGLAMEAQGNADALGEMSRAAKLAPRDNAIALEYGKAVAASGDDLRAASIFQAILARANKSADPVVTEVTYALALSLQRSGKMPESIPLLRRVMAKQPNNAAVLTNLGMALSQTQQTTQAIPVLQRAVLLAPNDVTAHQDLAAALVQLNQFADAIVELHAALQLSPDLPQLHYDLGFAYKMQDDAAHAIPELEAAERLDPNQAESPYLLGVLYMQTGRYEDAARELKRGLSLHPQNGDGWATLGSVYSKLDRLPEAITALEEAIRQLPQQPDPRLTLAAVLVKQNRAAEATEQRKQAALLMKQNMNRQRAEVATHSGESLLKSGDLAAATVQFNEALTYDASDVDAHLGLARIYDSQGRKIDAAAERHKAAAAVTASSQ